MREVPPYMSNETAPAGTRATIGSEPELRRRIDELADQPGGAHAIHARLRPRDPQSSAIVVGIEHAAFPRRRDGREIDARLEASQQRRHLVAASAAEDVQLLDRDEPLPQRVERPCDVGSLAATAPLPTLVSEKRRLGLGRDRLVGLLTRVPELAHQRAVDRSVDAMRHEHRRLSAAVVHLTPQPLEILAGAGRIRQHVHGLLHGEGADLLKASPDADAEVGCVGGELVHEQQPRMALAPQHRQIRQQRFVLSPSLSIYSAGGRSHACLGGRRPGGKPARAPPAPHPRLDRRNDTTSVCNRRYIGGAVMLRPCNAPRTRHEPESPRPDERRCFRESSQRLHTWPCGRSRRISCASVRQASAVR